MINTPNQPVTQKQNNVGRRGSRGPSSFHFLPPVKKYARLDIQVHSRNLPVHVFQILKFRVPIRPASAPLRLCGEIISAVTRRTAASAPTPSAAPLNPGAASLIFFMNAQENSPLTPSTGLEFIQTAIDHTRSAMLGFLRLYRRHRKTNPENAFFYFNSYLGAKERAAEWTAQLKTLLPILPAEKMANCFL